MPDETTVSEETAVASDEQDSSTESSIDETSEEQAQVEPEQTEEVKDDSELAKIDTSKLPPELQAVYKQMQAAFTKDRQAESDVKKKAQLYDQMIQDQMIQSKFPTPTQKAQPETTSYLAEALGVDPQSLEPEQKSQLETLAKIVDAAVSKQISTHINPIQQEMMTRDFKQELDQVKAKYPDFDQHQSEVADQLKANPQLTYEQAYMLATYQEREKKGRIDLAKNLQVKRAQASPKTTQAVRSDEGNIDSFEDAFRYAQNKVG